MALTERRALIPNNGSDNNRKVTCWSVTKKCLKAITVEPALLMFFLGYGVESVFITNLWVDKICRFNLNYSEAVCRAIHSGKYPEEQESVQKATTIFNMYAHILQYLPACFVVLLLGTWSDKRGRRLPIIVPFLGYFFTGLCVTAVSYWWSLSPIYLLISYLPLAFTGGLIGVYAGVYPYLTAVTSARARTTRISLLAVVILSSASVGMALGVELYKQLGYVGVFGSQTILTGCSIVYALLVLKDRPEGDVVRDVEGSEGVLHVLSPTYLKATLLVAFKKRDGGKRGDILGHIVIMMIMVLVSGSLNYTYLYARKKFHWDHATFSYYWMIDTPLAALGMLTIMPYLSYRWKVEDCILGLMGGISMLFSNVLKGTAPAPWVMYLASVAGMCLDQVTVASRGSVSKLVDKSEAGAVFAVLGAAEAMIPLLSNVIYTLIYNATLNVFPGMIFVFTAILSVIICCIYVWIMTRTREPSANGNYQPITDSINSNRLVYA